MKLIIAGTRTFNDYRRLRNEVETYLGDRRPTYVVCGMANGADMLGYRWAREVGLLVIVMPADWRKYGKAAGPIRNAQMADEGDELLVFWDGKSKGTKGMIDEMKLRSKPVHIVLYQEQLQGQLL